MGSLLFIFLDEGVDEGGSTLHFLNEGVDDGLSTLHFLNEGVDDGGSTLHFLDEGMDDGGSTLHFFNEGVDAEPSPIHSSSIHSFTEKVKNGGDPPINRHFIESRNGRRCPHSSLSQ